MNSEVKYNVEEYKMCVHEREERERFSGKNIDFFLEKIEPRMNISD